MKTTIPGVIVKKLTKFSDNRGWLSECFRQDELNRENYPVMSYAVMTKPSMVRGPHEHIEQTDFFCFTDSTKFKIYLWDNRKKSPAFGRKMNITIGTNGPEMLIIPPGVVHAIKNIGDRPASIINYPDRLYGGWGKKFKVDEIRHEDDPKSSFKIGD